MKFSVRQDFTFPSDVVAEGFTDPALYARFAELPKVTAPEVLSHDVEGDRIRLRIRYRFGGDLSSAARAVIDPAKLTWVDESVHDLGDNSVSFVLVPENYGDRFTCRGRYEFVDTPTGCTRRADIELKVSFPLVGRAVEGAIASGLREHLADEVGVVEAYLRERTS